MTDSPLEVDSIIPSCGCGKMMLKSNNNHCGTDYVMQPGLELVSKFTAYTPAIMTIGIVSK